MGRNQQLASFIDDAACQQALLFRVAWSPVSFYVTGKQLLCPSEDLGIDYRLVQTRKDFVEMHDLTDVDAVSQNIIQLRSIERSAPVASASRSSPNRFDDAAQVQFSMKQAHVAEPQVAIEEISNQGCVLLDDG